MTMMMENDRGYALCVILVGLPARGKSYIVNKMSRYLTWLGFKTRVFNVGQARRQMPGYEFHNHQFFSSSDENARQMREEIALGVLESLLEWLSDDPVRVGLFDATNTTVERRQKLRQRCAQCGVATLFIESVCDDPDVLEKNITLKLRNADYGRVDPAVARADFMARVSAYEQRYQTLGAVEEADSVRYIKMYNVGRKMTTHLCTGYLPGQIAMFLSNCHIESRNIWLSRHGQSQDNVKELLGGDSHLTSKGIAYAKALAEYLHELNVDNLTLWTSALNRTRETAKFVNLFSEQYGVRKKYQIVQSRLLNEIDAGACTGMTYKQVEKSMPQEFEARERDKLRYRYPHGGESYTDLIERLRPIIIELERYRTPIFVICHQAVMRVLLAYFIQAPQKDCPRLDCPLHQVVQLTPGPYDCQRADINLEVNVRSALATNHVFLEGAVFSESMHYNPNAGDPNQVSEMYQAQAQGFGERNISAQHSPAMSASTFNLGFNVVPSSPHAHHSLLSPAAPATPDSVSRQLTSTSSLLPLHPVPIPAAHYASLSSSLASLPPSVFATIQTQNRKERRESLRRSVDSLASIENSEAIVLTDSPASLSALIRTAVSPSPTDAVSPAVVMPIASSVASRRADFGLPPRLEWVRPHADFDEDLVSAEDEYVQFCESAETHP